MTPCGARQMSTFSGQLFKAAHTVSQLLARKWQRYGRPFVSVANKHTLLSPLAAFTGGVTAEAGRSPSRCRRGRTDGQRRVFSCASSRRRRPCTSASQSGLLTQEPSRDVREWSEARVLPCASSAFLVVGFRTPGRAGR